MTGGSRCLVAVGPVASTSVPAISARISAISSSAVSSPAIACWAAAIRISPSGVGRAVLPIRSSRRAPTSCSSWRIWLLTAGWVRPSADAAAERPPLRATSRSARNRSRLGRRLEAMSKSIRNDFDQKQKFPKWAMRSDSRWRRSAMDTSLSLPTGPIGGSFAWTVPEVLQRDDWICQLERSDIDEIEAAVRLTRAQGLAIQEIDRDCFPLGRLTTRLGALRAQIRSGLGFGYVKGLPVQRY